MIEGYIVRNQDGLLLLSKSNFIRDIYNGKWIKTDKILEITEDLFPDLKWENPPIKVKIIIESC